MGEWSEVDGRWVWTKDPPAEPPVAQQSLTVLAVARTAADVLTANGIIRSPEVVELAAAAGLDLAAAATLLQKESGGGRNVWGSDGVSTGGLYTKGGEVTKAAYLAYKANRSRLGYQGVGPAQLTYGPLQDRADALAGAWDWRSNVTVGFQLLAGYIKANGLRTGFRQYNGSGPAAEAYATDAMTKYATWQTRLAGAPAEDDLTPEQDAKLTAIYQQMSGSPEVGKWPGWPSFKGGSGYALSLLDYLRQADAQLQTVKNDLSAVRARTAPSPEDALEGAGPAIVKTGVTEDDVRRIVTEMLTELQQSPKPQQ